MCIFLCDMRHFPGTATQWWRIFTASVAHFDLLHLAFNVMSFYQLGVLEQDVYSSLSFAYLTCFLVVLTMIICTLMYHLAIYKHDMGHLLTQQAVGFSCVLFAWMVAMAVRLDKFCPLFFLPSMCFSTFHLPLYFISRKEVGVFGGRQSIFM